MIDRAFSEAVVVFIGKGRTRIPTPHAVRLSFEMGSEGARALLPRVRALIEEMGVIPVDRNRIDLDAATDQVVATIRERHPELSDGALLALDWLFSWSAR